VGPVLKLNSAEEKKGGFKKLLPQMWWGTIYKKKLGGQWGRKKPPLKRGLPLQQKNRGEGKKHERGEVPNIL